MGHFVLVIGKAQQSMTSIILTRGMELVKEVQLINVQCLINIREVRC